MSDANTFIPAERDPPEIVIECAKRFQDIPPLALILDSLPGVVLVLNDKRQILFANTSALEQLGSPLPELIGRRPGEALSCVHASESPDGCGAAPACGFCGAVEAILGARNAEDISKKEARISINDEGRIEAIDFDVTARRLEIDSMRLILVSMSDIRDLKRRIALERMFFHDILNTLTALYSSASLLVEEPGANSGRYAKNIVKSIEVLIEEIRYQHDFSAMERHELRPAIYAFAITELLKDATAIAASSAENRKISLETRIECAETIVMQSDPVLLRRAISNLIKNAIEASKAGEKVLIRLKQEGERAVFLVHNPAVMPEAVRHQVFQRSFSTKGEGRGIGTYSVRTIMKEYLKGEVSFESRQGEGTTFRLSLPLLFPEA